MPRYFFILGKNPTLSTAEIISVLNKLSVSFEINTISNEVLVVSTVGELKVTDLMRILGGTIKCGKIIDEVRFDEDEQIFEKIFEERNLMTNYLSKTEGKIHFGISVYDGGTNKNYLSEIVDRLKPLNINIKDNLKKTGVRAGFIRIKDRFISSVSVWKNQLLSAGFEMVLILSKDSILAGKTVAVQEFESFSFRDYGRPARDKRAGIIPPKLARMMINLAQTPKDGVILDPFCGSGTILQEAIILGYKNIIGSDVSANAVSDTNKNKDWLFANYRQLTKSSYNVDIYQSDIRIITQKIKENSADAVITEPFLGPPLFKMPDMATIQNIISEVSTLYITAFSSFHKILKERGKVVFVFPAFEMTGKMHFVLILDKIEKIGFRKLDYFSKDLSSNPAIRLTARNTILYGSPEHFVKREIISWQKG